jgi:GT2 family glycosyltransferase
MTEPRTTPTVSIVIPLYNKARYVKRALDSALAQTFRAIEVVVVDDGSTDASVSIVEANPDPRIRLIRQPNAGPGAARNHGIRESRGEFVAFLDADDEYFPDYIAYAVERLQANPECALVCCNRVWGAGKTLRDVALGLKPVDEGSWRLPPKLATDELIYAFSFLCTHSVLCRRTVLERFGGFYENRSTFGEDHYLWVRLVINNRIYRSPKPVAWWHTEASELSKGRKTMPPEPAYLADPDPIRDCCPAEYADLLERFLADRAQKQAALMVWYGEAGRARDLIDRFPRMKRLGARYRRLRLQLLFAPLIARLRSMGFLLRAARMLRFVPVLKTIITFDAYL